MNTLQTPFFLRSIENEHSRQALVCRIVARIEHHTNRPHSRQFNAWCAWLQRLNESRDVAPVRSLLDLVGDLARDSGIFSPYAIANESSPRDILEFANEAQEYDQDFLLDIARQQTSINRCASCNSWFDVDDMEPEHDGDMVCETCRDDHYQFSEFLDCWIHIEHSAPAISPRGREILIHQDADGYHWDDERECLVSDEYEPPEPPSIIRSYHSSKPHFCTRPDEWTAQHDRFLGVELEVECGSRNPGEVADAIHERINGGEFGRSIFFENDGSLSNGFEIISQPVSLPALREVFGFLRSSELLSGVRSHRTTTCGLHVHVSRSGLSNVTIARAVTFVNDPQNDAFITALARRYNTTYCKVAEKNIEDAHLAGDRYEAINLTGNATIEFRVFRGSLKYEAVIAAVEFCHALLEFCARPETGAKALNARAFLTFCANQLEAETRILRAYVDQRTAGVFAHSEAA